MKGHIQTWLVLNRNPFATAGEMGWPAFAMMQLTFGGALLASLMHGPILLWLAAGLFTPLVELHSWHAALFMLGYGSVLLAIIAARTSHKPWWALVTLPLYWPLASLAMLRAISDLQTRPHFWAKTPHGLAQPRRAPSAPTHAPDAPRDNVIQLEFPFPD